MPALTSLLPFEAAARLESFSRAADELHITQAAVSRQIRGLEEDLGVKLFVRRNRAVFLTEEGRQFGKRGEARHWEISATVLLRFENHGAKIVSFYSASYVKPFIG